MHPLVPHLVFIVINAILLALFVLRTIQHGPFRPSDKVNPNTSVLVPDIAANWAFWCLSHAVRGLVKFGFTPNRATVASCVFGVLAGCAYAAGWFAEAGWLIILSGSFDIMDGWLARETGRMTRAGGFIDSVTDRYVEIFLYLGLAIYWRTHWWMMLLCAVAVTGAIMVSYTRARGESMGVLYKKGLFQRGERIVLLAVVTTFSPFIQLLVDPDAVRPFHAPVAIVVGITALLANIGALQRFHAITGLIDAAEKDAVHASDESAPPQP